MKAVNERIALIIKEKCNGNRSQFARLIGITPAYAAQLYGGERIPSDRTITDICREFNISEAWLRTGEGKMSIDLSREAQITKFVGEALREESPSDRQRFLNALLGATPEELHAIAEFAKRLAKEYANEKRDDP